MKNFKFIPLLLVLFFVSCKKEGEVKNEKENTTNEKVVNDFFVIKLDVKGKKDDTFHVYYTEDKSLNFDESKTAWAEFISESNNVVNFKYNLPKDVLPNQLRLDFGVNNKDGISINNVEITYKTKTFNIPGAQVNNYFRPNELCTVFDKTSNTFKPLKAGDNISLYPTENLSVELEKLFM